MTVTIPDSCKVYTPRVLADAMVKSLGDAKGSHWLEPSVGQGVFLHALHSFSVSKRRVRAIDLDPTESNVDKRAQTLRGKNFLEWAHKTGERFDRIVGNPPYVPIRKLPHLQQSIATSVLTPNGDRIPLKANLWYAFFCASLNLLRPGGSIAFVLPASSVYAGYGSTVRKQLTELFAQSEVHRSEQPLFDEVLEGSVVFIGRGYLNEGKRYRQWTYKNLTYLCDGLTKARISAGHRCPAASSSQHEIARLSDYVEIGLGGVTGDAKYFLMTESEMQSRNLPATAMQPVLTRARQLTKGVMDRPEWNRMLRSDERIWLFNPTKVVSKRVAVRCYLELSPNKGGCDRSGYKVTSRTPWYATPMPSVVDGYISGMGSYGPWICLRRMKGLSATNTLYTVRFKSRYTLDERIAICLSLITPMVRKQLDRVGRVYAGGLVKFEPREIGAICIPPPIDVENPVQTYNMIIEQMRKYGRAEAEKLVADLS